MEKIKQEAHEPHRSPEKPVQSINKFEQSYDDIITMINKGENILSPMVLICKISSPLHPSMCAKFV